MPPRLVCVGILVFWLVTASALITRDVLPDLLIGSPPDLRVISNAADGSPRTTQWALLVAEDASMRSLRSIGKAVTETSLKKDGWVEMTSRVLIDGIDLPHSTPFEAIRDEQVEVNSNYQIDPSGNLYSFRAGVRSPTSPGELLALEGRLKGSVLEVRSKGPLPLFNWTRTFPYQPRGMVQNTLGPMDRMPGLQVGQRWESRIISPLTGAVQTVKVEVARKSVITWGNDPVVTLEVVAKAAPVSVRVWVRPDGLVLRQEVPLPFFRLVLERVPERSVSQAKAAGP